jgi:hypothetical protein
MPSDPAPAPAAARELAARLADAKPMRRGSLSQRSMKCGQKACRCHDDPKARHGPYFSVTRVERGKTRSRYVTAEQAAQVRAQVEAGQQFRKDVEAFWEACERWADAQLEAPEAASQEAAKKGGSKRRSTPKSSARSKR